MLGCRRALAIRVKFCNEPPLPIHLDAGGIDVTLNLIEKFFPREHGRKRTYSRTGLSPTPNRYTCGRMLTEFASAQSNRSCIGP
jgi:hypothetical protein